MTIQPKQTLKLFLIFGISSVFIALITGCKGTIDYKVRVDYVYVNETSHTISYPTGLENFNIAPQSTITHSFDSEGSKDTSLQSFESELLGCGGCIVKFDQTRCDTVENLGLNKLENYEGKELKSRYFEFKYRFTEKNFNEAAICK